MTRLVSMLAVLVLSACGGGGSDAPPAPTPDTTAPNTTLAGALLPLTTGNSVVFTFSATETSTFEARLDGAAFAAATSPMTISNLAEGTHTFEVRARDAAGNVDATPASATWVIDGTPPDTQITAAPSSTAVVTSSTFSFAATEAGSTLEVSVDDQPYGAQVSPLVLSGLSDGAHTIRIRARDAAGNVDPTPATATWSLDASAPALRLQFPTQTSYTDASTLTVRGTASDPAGVAAISVNGIAATTTDDFAHWLAVIPVQVIFTEIRVTSRDGLGNEAMSGLGSIYNRGPFVNRPMGIALDAPRNRFVIVDGLADAIVAMRRGDGVAQMLSAGSVPGTPGTPGFQSLAIDAANDRALVVATEADQLVAVDLVTGARSVVSPGAGFGSPTTLRSASSLTLDATGQNVYVTEAGTQSVLRIALANGARTVVSSPTLGTGPNANLLNPRDIVYDDATNPATPRLLVSTADTAQLGVIAIDIATGNRTPFSMGATGTGPAFAWAHGLALDRANQRLLVSDSNNAIVSVALATGNRTPLNITAPPTPVALQSNGHLEFDDTTGHVYLTQTNGSILDIDTTAHSSSMIAGSSLPNLSGTYLGLNGLAIEQSTGASSLIMLFGGTFGHMTRVDLANRSAPIVSGWGIGAGPPLETPVDFTLDRANNRAFVALGMLSSPRQIASVDLSTGNRSIVVDNTSGNLGSPHRLVHDAANNRLVFVKIDPATQQQELHAVSLATGNITPISDASATGPTLGGANQVVLEPAANPTRALLADLTSNRVLSVDLTTGTRTVFDTLPSGHAISLAVDGENSRLFVANYLAPSALVTVPLSTGGGMRQLISGIDPMSGVMRGTGPPQHYVEQFDVDVPNGVVYAASHGNVAILAIDVESGDRVVVAR